MYFWQIAQRGRVARMAGRGGLISRSIFGLAYAAMIVALGTLHAGPALGQEQSPITHTLLLRSELPDTLGQEVIVWDTRYAPGASNPRHRHLAAITFRVLSGTGVWQEDGKAPVTLNAGDSLFVPAGTIHSHWNPSTTEPLRFIEFIVAAKGEGRAIPQPLKN
jgi:quercetin dioxygenase-like cupin family protein